MKYKELPAPRPDHQQQPMLLCRGCHGEYSATPGDYFTRDPNEEITCGECGEHLELVDKTIKYVPVLTMRGQPDKRRGPKPYRGKVRR